MTEDERRSKALDAAEIVCLLIAAATILAALKILVETYVGPWLR